MLFETNALPGIDLRMFSGTNGLPKYVRMVQGRKNVLSNERAAWDLPKNVLQTNARNVRMFSQTNARTDVEERRFSAVLGIYLTRALAPGTC